jgi:hypothetical protein
LDAKAGTGNVIRRKATGSDGTEVRNNPDAVRDVIDGKIA